MSSATASPDRIRAVLFDFGGVLAEEGFQQGLRALAEKQHLDPDEMVRQGIEAVHDSGYVTGTGSESDFWALLRRRTGLVGTDAALTAEILDRFVLRPWMMEHVERLHAAGLITAILSDQTDWLELLDQRNDFSAAFDHVFNSYRIGKSKRDPSLFNDVLGSLGLAPDEALFIDDSPGHVQRARERGLNAIRFRNRDDFETRIQRMTHHR